MKNKLNGYAAKTPAKLNLSLCITGKRENLHTLDMIVSPFPELSDIAVFYPEQSTKIRKIRIVSGYKGLRKNAFKKYIRPHLQAIASKFNIGGDIYFYKNIPLGAGLGGSSACIVSAIKAMQKYCSDIGKSCETDASFLLSLGSDVPCMYRGGICRVQGVGEIVFPLTCTHPLEFKVTIAKGGSNSAECYKLYDDLSENNEAKISRIPQSVEEAVSLNRNDLLEAAQILNPHIKDAIDALKKAGNNKVFMSGSGSAVFCAEFAAESDNQ